MKTAKTEWLRFLVTYFLIYGVLEFLLFARSFLPSFSHAQPFHMAVNYAAAALILTVAHCVISSERLDSCVSLRSRVILCGIPIVVTLGFILYDLGIHGLIRELLSLTAQDQKVAASIAYVLSYLLCFAAAVFAYWRLERYFSIIGREYDAALAEYKKNADMEY